MASFFQGLAVCTQPVNLLLLFLCLHFFYESTVFCCIFIGLAKDIYRCLVKIRLMFLDDCKLLIDMFAEWTAYTAGSP